MFDVSFSRSKKQKTAARQPPSNSPSLFSGQIVHQIKFHFLPSRCPHVHLTFSSALNVTPHSPSSPPSSHKENMLRLMETRVSGNHVLVRLGLHLQKSSPPALARITKTSAQPISPPLQPLITQANINLHLNTMQNIG